MRPEMLTVRLSAEEVCVLRRFARRQTKSVSDVVREAIRAAMTDTATRAAD